MLSIRKFIEIFFSIATIVFAALLIYINKVELELNERLGSEIFYLKGYYEENNMIVTEQGIGIIFIPLIAGFICAGFLVLIMNLKKGTCKI
ncbi:hypothetical protein ACQKNB_08270 [Lysinibacillus xylanilyticus]|uniref:hypothetical protein n=1 Tax=Lysinibacillus xylanilyticus TaxID=582475 RepID=UPI003D0808B4